MSTRASIVVYSEWGNAPICEIYKHWDGYPDGLGKRLHEFCDPIHIVNGIGMAMGMGTHANGMGDLAAQIVKHFKTSIGDVGLIPLGTDWGQEYKYHVRAKEGRVQIEVEEVQAKN